MSDAKLAVQVADTLERRIVGLGWPIGHLIGLEADLIAEFAISRAVLREAILILEQRQMVVRRRGPGGGVSVRAPKASGVAITVARYLEYVGLRGADLMDARMMVDLYCVARAAKAANTVAAQALRDHAAAGMGLAAEHIPAHTLRFHRLLVEMTGNPVLILFHDVLTQIANDFFIRAGAALTREVIDGLVGRRMRLAGAIVAGNADQARAEMQAYIEEVTQRFT